MKTKGDRFERELAAHLNQECYTVTQSAYRAPLSGGGFVMSSGGADLVGTPDLFVEAKRVERCNFKEAMRQAERNAIDTKSPETPIVINRMNHMKIKDSYCVLRLENFIKYYNAWLKQEGIR
jgi:hypothetical protein